MQMSNEGLLVILFVGLVAGWLAGKIVRGTGFGIIGDILVGIAGALIASWLFPRLGIHLGAGIVSEIIYSAIGAIVLLLIVRLIRTGGRSELCGITLQKGAVPRTARSAWIDAVADYSTTSTIRWVRGSTRTVRPLTTV